ncbi:unnamed protein product [Lupinus luteus]|uniref:CWZF3/5/7 THD domain-containing protein n=1 Tax=Lupinus luteus TaxID=3873 RepID=A0AAV1VZT8_LUPLU
MMEFELEEGEPCSYQNHEDYDVTVDPDISLSYIDEKLQDVLGHFQKDFEGGVSSENLGAKFGGYGSFLPTYQRSPVCSHPRIPQKNHSQNMARSPNNVRREGAQGDAVQFSTRTQSSRPTVMTPSIDKGINHEKCMLTTSAEAFNSKCKPQNMKTTSLSDQKTPKVRIKMGLNNLPTRKNAVIYSGLGLDMLPSSSPDESPSESEGISCSPQGAPFESPTSILQIMADLPMPLASPLPSHFIELIVKETRGRVTIPSLVHMDNKESSGVLCPGLHQLNNDQHAVPGGKTQIVKDMSNSANKDDFSPLSPARKKNLQSSVKSKSLNDVNKSPDVGEANSPGEKHKSKPKMLENYSDRGDIKNIKRGHDQDCSSPSKKGKSDKVHSTDVEWNLELRESSRKLGHSSKSSFPATSVRKDRPRHEERSSLRGSKLGKERMRVSSENTKDKGQVSMDGRSLDLRNYDWSDSKKRKLKECQDAQICSTSSPHQQDSRISMQEFSNSWKEKKARSSKSEGRESSASEGSDRTDKKWDLGSVQASFASTLSSSKVSSSHKTKAIFQEVKGSVESVSLSPMRTLSTEKFTGMKLVGKNDFHDTAALDSPRICSDGEDDGGNDRSGTTKKNKSFTMAHRSDFQNKGVNNLSDSKPKAQTASHCTNGCVDNITQDGKYPGLEQQIRDLAEDRPDDVSRTRKSGVESGLKDKNESSKSKSHAEMVENTISSIQLQNQSPLCEEKHRDGKVKLQENFGFKPDQSATIRSGKKDYTGKGESGKTENHLNGGQYYEEVSIDGICKQEATHAPSHHQLRDCDTERSSKRSLLKRSDHKVHGIGKSLSLLPSGGAQTEIFGCCPRPVVGFHKGDGDMEVDPSKVDDVSKLHKKQPETAGHQNETQQVSLSNTALNGHRSKELNAPSPMRRDSYSHAANNAVKEAKDLKHLADRLKNSGSALESTSLYFQAALKFLHGASLLESGDNTNAKHDEIFRSRQMFCAHEYEKSKDMASAALAYKCTEVAYMRVIFSSHTSAGRDRNVLQTALQMVPLGESPSSSASDFDNVNNSTAADKVILSKSVNSPQVAGNHIIAARNRPNLVRLLSFAQDMNFAMEASRRSRNAFAAANSSPGVGKNAYDISSIKKALDFSFQDVEGLLRLKFEINFHLLFLSPPGGVKASDPLHSYPQQIEKLGPVSNVWRVMQQNMTPSYHHSERNQNNYNNTLVGGSMQSGSSWDRNNHATREGYETWSPENSPTRNPRSVPGRNFNESRMDNNHGRNQRLEWSRHQWGSSGQGNKKWHDQRQ